MMRSRWLLASAWLSLAFERLEHGFSVFFMALCATVASLAFGLLVGLAFVWYFVFLMALGFILLVVFVFGVLAFKGFPTLKEARYALESRQKHVRHNPFTQLADAPAGGPLPATPPIAEPAVFWQNAQLWAKEQTLKAHAILPQSQALSLDPWRLRYFLFLLALVAILFDYSYNFMGIKAIAFKEVPPAMVVQATIAPPVYAQNTPIVPLKNGQAEIKLLPNSTLSLKVYTPEKPQEQSNAAKSLGGVTLTHGSKTYPLACAQGVCKIALPLHEGGRLMLAYKKTPFFSVFTTLLADNPPKIRRNGPFSFTPEGQLIAPFKAEDDYGLKEASLFFVRGGREVQKPLLLPKQGEKTAESISYLDLTTDLFAGLEVEVFFKATDVAGQSSASAPEKLTLPEKPFYHKVAKKLVAMRRSLLQGEAQSPTLRPYLEDVLKTPEAFEKNLRAYLSIRLAAENTDNPQAKQRLAGLLWDAALHIEKGPLGLELEGVKAAQQALQEALATGQNHEKVAELFRNFAARLQAFLQYAQFSTPTQNEGEGVAPTLKNDDFSALLSQIEGLLKAGATEKAQAYLKKLETLLAHISFNTESMFEEFAAVAEQIKKTIASQRALLEALFNKQPPLNMAENRQQQQRIANALEEAVKTLEALGVDSSSFKKALEAMALAIKLSEEEGLEPLVQRVQNYALQLLEGAQAQMVEALRHQAGYGGLKGFRRDPAGRLHQTSEELQLPTQAPVLKARQIRDLLFEKAAQPETDDATHQYLQRLLQGL